MNAFDVVVIVALVGIGAWGLKRILLRMNWEAARKAAPETKGE